MKDSSGGFRATFARDQPPAFALARVETTFRQPIPTPKGKPLVTLKDAAAYIMALPNKEAASPEWQAGARIEALMLVAELDGPTMFTRIVVMRALNRAARFRGLIQCGKIHIRGDGNRRGTP